MEVPDGKWQDGKGTRVIAQQVKSLLCMGITADPQNPGRSWADMGASSNTSTKEVETQAIPRAKWITYTTQNWWAPGLRDPTSTNESGEQSKLCKMQPSYFVLILVINTWSCTEDWRMLRHGVRLLPKTARRTESQWGINAYLYCWYETNTFCWFFFLRWV